jgi:hypothetical protein
MQYSAQLTLTIYRLLTAIVTFSCLFYIANMKKILILVFMLSCQQADKSKSKSGTGTCECQLSEQDMVRKCPVVADDDSVVICKVGTNDMIGSGRGPMTWPNSLPANTMVAKDSW